MSQENAYCDISKITRFLFIATILMYIILVSGYRVHVIPQVLLVVLIAAAMLLKKRIYNVSKKERGLLIFLMVTGTFLIMLNELQSDQPQYAMPIKYLLNTTMLLLILFTYPSSTVSVKETQFFGISLLITGIIIAKYATDNSHNSLVYLVIAFLMGDMSSIDQYRAADSIRGVFGHKNLFATFISSISACYLEYLYVNDIKISYKSFAIMLTFFIGIVLTFSRSGMFIYFISISVYVLLRVKNEYFKGAIFLVFGSLIWLMLQNHVTMQIQDGFYSRILLWKEFFINMSSYGLLGQGSYLGGEIEAYDNGMFFESGNFHNYVFNQVASYGIVFLVVFTINGWMILKKLYNMFGTVVVIPIAVFFSNNMFQNWGFEYQSYLPFIFLFFVVTAEKRVQSGAQIYKDETG